MLFFCSVYQYPANPPSTSVIVMILWSFSRYEKLTILSAPVATALEPISVRTNHSPPCVIHIHKCHFRGCSLFTSCHSCRRLYMTFPLYFSQFLKQATFPPMERLLLTPLTSSSYLAFLFHPCIFFSKILTSLVISYNMGLPYSRF